MMSNVKAGAFFCLIVVSSVFVTACGGADEEQKEANDGNNAPTISGTPNGTIEYGSDYSFTPVASDPDSDPLTFSIINRPIWASFDQTSGAISGTPTFDNIGRFSGIVISVSDGQANSALDPFDIVVMDNQAAAGLFNYSSANYSINEGATITVTVTRTNISNDASVFYETVGASAVNGQDYTGFPPRELFFTAGQSSSTFDISTIDDGDIEADEAFSVHLSSPSSGYVLGNVSITTITITDNDASPTNRAPSISGTPVPSITEGSYYSFTPIASDPDGDAITFSITNPPVWAMFSESSGALSGTPGTEHVGTTNNITISVSDGSLSSSLAQFSITVSSATNSGTVTLNWLPPARNIDESEVTDLAGFKIYYGTTDENIAEQFVINNPGVTSYVVEGLPSQSTFSFAVSAFDEAGQESTISNIVRKTAQ